MSKLKTNLLIEVESDGESIGCPADDKDDEDAEKHAGGPQCLEPGLALTQSLRFLASHILEQVQVVLGTETCKKKKQL